MTRLIQLSRAQWMVLAVFVGLTFPLVMLLAFMPSVANWYTVATLAPALERELAFSAEVTRHPAFPTRETFSIVSVKPGGIFDRAGIRAGDIPMNVHHGCGEFYALLHRHRGQPVELRLLRMKGGPSDTLPAEQRLTVVVPRPAG